MHPHSSVQTMKSLHPPSKMFPKRKNPREQGSPARKTQKVKMVNVAAASILGAYGSGGLCNRCL